MEYFHAEYPNRFNLPRRINRLGGIAHNLWWTWNPDSQRLLMRIDRDLWDRLNHNPVRFLRTVERARLDAMIHDRYYLEFYDRIFRSFDQYMQKTHTWCARTHPEFENRPIAYFST